MAGAEMHFSRMCTHTSRSVYRVEQNSTDTPPPSLSLSDHLLNNDMSGARSRAIIGPGLVDHVDSLSQSEALRPVPCSILRSALSPRVLVLHRQATLHVNWDQPIVSLSRTRH